MYNIIVLHINGDDIVYLLKYYYDLIHNNRDLIAENCELKLKMVYLVKENISLNLLQINEMYNEYVHFNNLLDSETSSE